jgi:hypothetical protein
MKKIFGLTLALLVFMIAANGLWAQAAPTGILESPQSISTQGRYRSNADDFIRTDYYTNVKFNTFFAYTSFASINKGTLGFGTKVGDVYLAAYYGGNFWAGKTDFTYTEQNHAFNGGYKNFSTYGTEPLFTGTVPDNRVALLIGLANMGIRLSYAWTLESFKEDNIAYNTATAPDPVEYAYMKNYERSFGVISPQIEWAMAKDLTEKNGLRPRILFNLNFIRDYQTSRAYDASDGSTADERIGMSNNYMEPHLAIYPNGYHVYNKNGFRLTVDLEYEFKMRIYKNDYSYLDVDGISWKTDTIKGLNTNGNLTEKSYMDHLITPSLAGQWSGGNLALRFKLNLPVGITSEGTTAVAANSDLDKEGQDLKALALRFQPNLRLAAQWKALPDKLHLNLGGRLNLSNISRTTTKGSSYTAGEETDHSDIKRVATTFANTGNSLGLGVTFLPTQNLTFEANCGITATDNSVKVFDSNGLFSFGSILASLRY